MYLQSTSQAKRDADSDDSMDTGGRDPPNIFWRVFAALMYIIPWIDVIALGREVYHNFPFSITLFLIPGMQHSTLTCCCCYCSCGCYCLVMVTGLMSCRITSHHTVFFAGPFVGIYYSSQFAPLVVFFLLFLSVVKNTKLHHFVRFNAMQVRMSCSMLITLAWHDTAADACSQRLGMHVILNMFHPGTALLSQLGSAIILHA